MATLNRIPSADSPTPVPVVAYARCSTDQQDRSVGDQLQGISQHCATVLWPLAPEWDTFFDDGISGLFSRDGLDRLLHYVERHREGGVVVIEHRDRISRATPYEAETIELRIRAAGWKLHFLNGHNDTGNALTDAVVPSIERAMAHEYSHELSRKTCRGLAKHVYTQLPGGKINYGLCKILIEADGTERVIPRVGKKHRKQRDIETSRLEPGVNEEVETVRGRLFAAYATGMASDGAIAEALNEAGIPSPSGGKWKPGGVRSILTNPIYAGDVVFNRRTHAKLYRISDGSAVAHEAHDSERGGETRWAKNDESDWIVIRDHPLVTALIDRATFDRCQEIRAERAKNKGRRSPAYPYALAGLAECRGCGGKMHGVRVDRNGRRGYRCGTYLTLKMCECYTVEEEPLRRLVLQLLREEYVPRMDRDRFRGLVVQELAEQQGTSSTAEIEGLRRRHRKLKREVVTLTRNLREVPPAVARELGTQVGGLITDRDKLAERLEEAERQAGAVANVEHAADEIVATAYGLEDVQGASPLATRELLGQLVEKVELTFKTEVVGTTKKGKPRKKHTLVSGVIVAASLLLAACSFGACSAGGEPTSRGRGPWVSSTRSAGNSCPWVP